MTVVARTDVPTFIILKYAEVTFIVVYFYNIYSLIANPVFGTYDIIKFIYCLFNDAVRVFQYSW
jgi:hypothetical protein